MVYSTIKGITSFNSKSTLIPHITVDGIGPGGAWAGK